MLARMKLRSSEMTPPSPAAILAAVPKPAALVKAEERLAALRAGREQLMDEIRGLAARRGDRDVDRQLVALHERREDLEGKIRDARRYRAEALEPHQQRVSAALAPAAHTTSERIRAAVAELDAALQVGAEIVAAGMVRDLDVPALCAHQVDAIEQFAQRLAKRYR